MEALIGRIPRYCSTALHIIRRLQPRPQKIDQTAFDRIRELGLLKPLRGCKAGVRLRRPICVGNIVSQFTVSNVNNKYCSQLMPIPTITSNRYNLTAVKPSNNSTQPAVLSITRKRANTNSSTVNTRNLLSIPTQPVPDSNHEQNLCVGMLNAQSCRNKADHLADFVMDNHVDLLAVTETWLSPGERDRAVRGELTPPGYKLLDVPRTKGRGGGVALVYRDNLTVKKQKVRDSARVI